MKKILLILPLLTLLNFNKLFAQVTNLTKIPEDTISYKTDTLQTKRVSLNVGILPAFEVLNKRNANVTLAEMAGITFRKYSSSSGFFWNADLSGMQIVRNKDEYTFFCKVTLGVGEIADGKNIEYHFSYYFNTYKAPMVGLGYTFETISIPISIEAFKNFKSKVYYLGFGVKIPLYSIDF